MAVSKALRYQILRRDNNTCRTCGRSAPEVKLHVDHVVPEALGGRTEPSNLQTLCADCNGGKSATPADAAMVERVSADAVRWADAQQVVVARMLQQHRAKSSVYSQVDAAWSNWCDGKLDRPADWRQSVDQLVNAGLPLEMFTDAIDIACGNTSIRERNIWRYACGIGWKRVAEIREATAGEVSSDSASEMTATDAAGEIRAKRDEWEMTGWNTGRVELADQILDYFGPDGRHDLLVNAHRMALIEGDELEEREGDDTPYLVGRAALLAFEQFRCRAIRVERVAGRILETLDSFTRADITLTATAQLDGANPEDGYTEDEATWWTLYHLADRITDGQLAVVATGQAQAA